MLFSAIKQLHIALALISVAGFALRGGLMLVESNYLNRLWIRRVPHIVDTCLLTSGVYLAWASQQYPFVNSYWLSVKLMALVAYIGFGLLALKHGRSKAMRAIAFVIAMGCALFMIATARQHSPLLLG